MTDSARKRSKPLEIVERIIRNAVKDPEFWFIDTKSGRLYFGLGTNANGDYVGVWAFTRGPGVCQMIEFAPKQMRALVIKELLENGASMLLEMEAKGLLMEGAFKRG